MAYNLREIEKDYSLEDGALDGLNILEIYKLTGASDGELDCYDSYNENFEGPYSVYWKQQDSPNFPQRFRRINKDYLNLNVAKKVADLLYRTMLVPGGCSEAIIKNKYGEVIYSSECNEHSTSDDMRKMNELVGQKVWRV